MPLSKPSKGTCSFCGTEITSSDATKHLTVCSKRKSAITTAQTKGNKSELLFHLRIQDEWRNEFWLDLEMRGSSSLKTLDSYLRAIWLECCGHMSEFSFGRSHSGKVSMSKKAQDVLSRGTKLTHIYDFGTSSHAVIKVVGIRTGAVLGKHPIVLMARNSMPEVCCVQCEKPGIWLCMECVIEKDLWGTLCDSHSKSHPHDNYGGPIRVVNSPRLGMCGYCGPANPPY